MNKDVVFTGSTKADSWLIFAYLSEVVADTEVKSFFSYNKELSKKLAINYSKSKVEKIICDAYTLVDENGNSLLSLAYEHNNLNVVNAIMSFILAHGYENEELYLPLISPKFLMLNRKVGYIGNFADNLVSIFKQMINSGNTKWVKKLTACYSFISVTNEDEAVAATAIRSKKHSKQIPQKRQKMPLLSALVVKFLKLKQHRDSFWLEAVSKVF